MKSVSKFQGTQASVNVSITPVELKSIQGRM